jgi:nicotinate-nucleotide adenylyltransferase
MVNYLPKWEGIEELTTMLHFIGLQRPGSFLELDLLPSFIQDVVLLAEMPLVDISSSLIRNRRAAGHSVHYMVTEEVHEYIMRRGLYAVHS